MAPPAKSYYLAVKQAFTNVIKSSGAIYLTNGSNLLTYPQNGASPANQQANYAKLLNAATVMRETPEVVVEQVIELFEINCKSITEFVTNDCGNDPKNIEETLRGLFGLGQIASMQVGATQPSGGYSEGDTGAATRLIDYLAGITAFDLL